MRFSLYWCTTADHGEDWFVVAESAAKARRFHEDAEGFNRGDAHAERILALPASLLCPGGWCDGQSGAVQSAAGWPTDELLVACGGTIGRLPRDPLRHAMGEVCKDVVIAGRRFRAGSIVSSVAQTMGAVEPPRLSVFNGAPQPKPRG